MATPTTLFTLPPHLRESIAALVAASIAPERLQADLKDAMAAADVEEIEEPLEDELAERETGGGGDDAESESRPPPSPQRKPPTVDGDLLDAVATWAGTGSASEALVSAGLDPADYSFIGLLAGTEVYLPPLQRKLAAAADKALAEKEKANPYLPTYMSPTPPSLGSEYRQLSRQLATVVNILFSVFGVGGGVYVAAKSAGWTREAAMLLAILGGVVVGIADSVLVWIFKVRLKKDRKDSAKRRVKMNTGSAAIPGSGRVVTLGGEGEGEAGEGKEAVLALEGGEVDGASTSATERPKLRLRRKPLNVE